VARPETLAKHSKGCCIHLHTPSYSSHIMPSTLRFMTIVPKMGHMITVGLPMLRVKSQNPPDGLELPGAARARDEVTQGAASS
jgi:hypothetical protein